MYGRACLDCGVVVFDELRRGIQQIGPFCPTLTPARFEVGGSEPMMADFIPSIIDQLARQYPRIVFHSVVGDGKALHDALRARRVDLIVSRRLARRGR